MAGLSFFRPEAWDSTGKPANVAPTSPATAALNNLDTFFIDPPLCFS